MDPMSDRIRVALAYLDFMIAKEKYDPPYEDRGRVERKAEMLWDKAANLLLVAQAASNWLPGLVNSAAAVTAEGDLCDKEEEDEELASDEVFVFDDNEDWGEEFVVETERGCGDDSYSRVFPMLELPDGSFEAIDQSDAAFYTFYEEDPWLEDD